MSKALARLNPKLTNFAPSGVGGHGSITPQDIAAALGYCKDPLATRLLRVKYAGHDCDRRALAIGFKEHLEAVAYKKGWRSKKELVYERLAVGTILEYLDKRCAVCGGQGVVRRNNEGTSKAAGYLPRVEVVCEGCNGTGALQPEQANQEERARQLNMTRTSFMDTWLARWDFALSELTRLDAMGNSAVKNGLADD